MTSVPGAETPTRAARHGASAALPGPAADDRAPSPRGRAVVVLGAVLAGLVLVGASLLDQPQLPIYALGLLGLVVAAGWPALVGADAPVGSALVIAVTVAACVGLLLLDETASLEVASVGLAIGVVATCLLPLVSPAARTDLVLTLAACALGTAIIACGVVLLATPDGPRSPLLVVGVGLALAALPDLVLERPRAHAWMLPVGILMGGLGGALAEIAAGGRLGAWAALLGGLAAGVALCLRRVLSQVPGVDTVLGGLAAGVASVLITGPVVYLLVRTLLG